MGINVKGVFFAFTRALPHFRPGGAAVFTATATHARGRPGDPLYLATKTAVRSLGRSLAGDDAVLVKRIRVNVVSPGATETPLTIAAHGSPEVRSYVDQIYVAGAELAVDGGLGQVLRRSRDGVRFRVARSLSLAARHALGLSPVTLRKSVLKCCEEAHPISIAIRVKLASLSSIARFASRTWVSTSSPRNVVPASLSRRCSVRGETRSSRAACATVLLVGVDSRSCRSSRVSASAEGVPVARSSVVCGALSASMRCAGSVSGNE